VTEQQVLLEQARSGDEIAFGELVEAHRAGLHAHCYRMLGSVHDAEDALQDALLRAWKGLPGFEGRSSLRTWLYTIVTNAALDVARRRPAGEFPAGFSPASGPDTGEPGWLEPYPDHAFGDRLTASPEARYEQRESLELAFIVALQHLPPLQRAVLILRDVVGFSARETADVLVTSVPAVTSALQRARTAAESRLPARSQQAVLRSLGDERIRALAARYADAMQRGDADQLVSMLASDVAYSMPPTSTCLRSHEVIREFVREDVAAVAWLHRATRASGQLAIGCYILDRDRGTYVGSVIDVLTLDGEAITAIHAFFTPERLRLDGCAGFPAAIDFGRFGLPAELPAGE
jgi:RNA polymerase sigma-70 factor, ECF subfamily